eukprot:TRINITY_DN3875_c0_g2_i1.p1 TRINITY_DN3875_c0_g2~~TRINITY_DN3875_c0_g2_i1.p1  ORF type:complete len:1108 (+),score=473.13 TRINITY_DN3875_c0_g2_i1:112-3435(+)
MPRRTLSLCVCLAALCAARVDGTALPIQGGSLAGTTCTVEAVEKVNFQQLNTILEELLNTTFFRIFKVDLHRPCYRDETVKPKCTGPGTGGMGGMMDSAFSAPMGGGFSSTKGGAGSAEDEEDKGGKCSLTSEKVDTSLSIVEEHAGELFDSDRTCDPNLPEFWLDMCSHIPTHTSTSETVNLVLNPEAYTGYNGTAVWGRIHELAATFDFVDGQASDGERCYEGRVLQRLISGMHTSISVHICQNFFPPRKSKGTTTYQPNPEMFLKTANNAEYLENLHFTFVVVLRSLLKAGEVLKRVRIPTPEDNPAERRRTAELLDRLLDSPILESCRPVFTAFDESLMFKATTPDLKNQFKWVFKNVSAELDCVTCQKCKLHGKQFLLGLGTALKILLVPNNVLGESLAHDEVVALINTAGKLSSAIIYLRKLTEFAELQKTPPPTPPRPPPPPVSPPPPPPPVQPPTPPPSPVPSGGAPVPFEVLDVGVQRVAKHVARGDVHDQILHRVLKQDAPLLALARWYDGEEFAKHATHHVATTPFAGAAAAAAAGPAQDADAIVIGAGLAGMTSALVLLDAGLKVLLVEKESYVGGNSALASSGINGVDEAAKLSQGNDTVAAYVTDIIKSSGAAEVYPLAQALAEHSGKAVRFVTDRVGLALDKVVQMGGHSFPRTYRPSQGMAGAEIVLALNAQVEKYAKAGMYKSFKKSRATELITDASGGVTGVKVEDKKGAATSLTAPHVVLASGGFAIGRTEGSLLQEVRPDLNKFATTNGRWCTGDGHRMASRVHGQTVDMEQVQIHPTGFIDPKKPDANTKTLCAELLRGMGGILLLRNGSRFVNELGTRQHVTAQMVAADPEGLSFTMLVHEKAAKLADKHIPLYTGKGLLKKADNVAALAKDLNLSEATLRATLATYNAAAAAGDDGFGKQHFNNAPIELDGAFWHGQVTPVLHYTMGGLAVDEHARVLGTDGKAIRGLYAAGEVIGGLHGKNRLGGNALTECVVFGMIAGETIAAASKLPPQGGGGDVPPPQEAAAVPGSRVITKAELEHHNKEGDLWVALHGKVYDLTDFVEEHPAGPEAILKCGGIEGTEIFATAHSEATLSVFEPLGEYKE